MPVSPYHCGSPYFSGSGLKEPRGCLSNPTAKSVSNSTALIAQYADSTAEPPVAKTFATLMNYIPERHIRGIKASEFHEADDTQNDDSPTTQTSPHTIKQTQ